MKKALVIMMLVVAAPLYAGTMTFTDNGGGVAAWSSDVAIVGVGLNVDATTAVTAVVVDGGTGPFDVFMDAAHDEEAGDGYTYGEGTPIADQGDAGELTLPLSVFAISMGILGDPTPVGGATSGVIAFTGGGTITLSANGLRGGVIDENGAQVALAGDLVITVIPPECFSSGAGVKYDDWVDFGSPDCWCYQRQCNADYNGLSAGTTFSGIQWVTVPDLTGLLNTFNVYEPGGVLNSGPGVLSIDGGNGICADFNHVGAGTSFSGIQRVTVPDLTLLLANFNVYEPGGILNSGPGVPVCPLVGGGGDIVFYTN